MKIIKASRLDKENYGHEEIFQGIFYIDLEDVLIEVDEDYELIYYEDDNSWASGPDDGDWYDGMTGNIVLSQSEVLNIVLLHLEDEITQEPGIFKINGKFTIPYTMTDSGDVGLIYSKCEFDNLSVERIY